MYFEIHKNVLLGQYWWVIKATNHQTLATSEMYVSKQGARNAIDVIVGIGNESRNIYDKTGEA
ncbi:MAG: hypothetical protein JWO99_460 [Candidatus Saccharibacteria bacterium]|nr:hypothetical protein [Candidatus Saccharibacteria bacterium]